jgi:hypothetical protein
VSKKRLLIVGVIVVVIVLFVGLPALFNRGKKPSTAGNSSAAVGTKTINATSPGLPAGVATQNLTFSGDINGTMTTAIQGDGFNCMPSAIGPMQGDLNGVSYSVSFRAINAGGPGTFHDIFIGFNQVGSASVYYSATGTILTINNDKRSGAISGDLVNTDDSNKIVHIKGTWACPPTI